MTIVDRNSDEYIHTRNFRRNGRSRENERDRIEKVTALKEGITNM